MNSFALQQHAGRPFLRAQHRRAELRLRPTAAYQTMAVTAPPTTSPGVVVMTIPACPYCRRAKAALVDAHIPFQELDASIDPELRSLVRQLSGSRTVPQVFVGGQSFGGSDELAEGLATGTFQAAVAEAAAAGKAPLPEAISQRVDQVAQERLAAAAAAAAAAQEAAEAAVAAAAVAAAVTGTWSGAEARPLAPVALASVTNPSGSGSGSGSTWSGTDSGDVEEPRQPVDIQAIRLQGVMELMTDPIAGIPRKPRRIGGRPQFPTFSGQDLLDWISRFGVSAPPASIASRSTSAARQWLSQHCYTAAGAAAAGAQLLAANRISVACDNLPPVSQESPTAVTMASMDDVLGDSWDSMTYAAVSDMPQVDVNAQYVIVGEVPMLLKGQPLNTTYWWNGRARAASQVAQDLRELIMQLYDKHLSADGRAVNYEGIKQDPLFAKYMAATAELQRIELDPLSREELCALFINLYNALIIHALVVYGPPTSTTQRMSFFTKDASYCVAGQTYSADDMENGVLRGNRPAASNLLVLVGANKLAGGQFKKSDPRARKVVIPMDPRIHFALVCGAKSCPPISIYTPDNLDEGLDAAGEAFCSSEVEVDVPNRTVTLSKIFQWYSVDFGENDTEKLKFVLQFLKGKQAEGLGTLLNSGKPIKVQYKPYNWDLNT